MRRLSEFAVLCLLALVFIFDTMPLASLAQDSKPRQYYGTRGWHQDSGKGYYSHYYYYKTRPLDRNYKEQVIVYQPSRSKDWVYWYNPESGKFWGRCPTGYNAIYGDAVNSGVDYWSLLPEKYQGNDLSKIKDEDFGKVVPREANPCVPGSSDGIKILAFPIGKKYLPSGMEKE